MNFVAKILILSDVIIVSAFGFLQSRLPVMRVVSNFI